MQKQQEISKKYLLLLFLYGIFAFIFFCIILFPKKQLVRHAMHLLSERLNCIVTTQDVQIHFPGKLEIREVKITGKQADAEATPLLYIEKIYLRPKLSQLFLKKINLLFNLHLYHGNLNGSANFDLFHPQKLLDLHCLVREIQLSDIKQIQELFNIHFTGKLSAEAKIKSSQNNLLNGTGEYTFTITPGDAQIMNFPNFTFQRIQGDGNLNQGKVKIQSIRIQSDELQAQITGYLRLEQNIAKSYLNTRVHLKITQKLQKRLGALASLLPKQKQGGIRLNIKGNLNALTFRPI